MSINKGKPHATRQEVSLERAARITIRMRKRTHCACTLSDSVEIPLSKSTLRRSLMNVQRKRTWCAAVTTKPIVSFLGNFIPSSLCSAPYSKTSSPGKVNQFVRFVCIFRPNFPLVNIILDGRVPAHLVKVIYMFQLLYSSKRYLLTVYRWLTVSLKTVNGWSKTNYLGIGFVIRQRDVFAFESPILPANSLGVYSHVL